MKKNSIRPNPHTGQGDCRRFPSEPIINTPSTASRPNENSNVGKFKEPDKEYEHLNTPTLAPINHGVFNPENMIKICQELGPFLVKKNNAYGDAFVKAGDFMQIFFEEGIPADKEMVALVFARVFDKLMRIAKSNNGKDPHNEDPWRDIAGYALLMIEYNQRKRDGK